MSVTAREVTTPHPSTVTAVSTGQVRRQRRSQPLGRPRTTSPEVRPTAHHPAAWEAAVALAGGDKSRVRVNPNGSVEVCNHPVR